ncbi:MAG: cysteine hydrolase [Alphaproteobacteria bacterium]|nr:cysteine hydrolase [Alphaproteobacteria bacterium]
MPDALIVIDMQRAGFVDAPPKHDATGLIGRLNRLAAAVRTAGGTVIFVQHDGPAGDPFHPSLPGWQLVEDLDIRTEDRIVRKTACDSFLGTNLESLLRWLGTDRLLVTGWATDYCVDTTVRSALARYPTVVPSDGHTTSDRAHLLAAKIIEHHNAIWADFIAPKGPAIVQPCASLCF